MKKRKSKTLTHTTSRRRRRRCSKGHVTSPDEWRDWASLPRDVLCVILGKLPQTDVLPAAGLQCSPWRRLAALEEEPQQWRHIDLGLHLRQGDPWDWPEVPEPQPPRPAIWKAMARAAVDHSAGQCESFRGHVDADVLVHLANRAPLLKKLIVTGWPCIPDKEVIRAIIKKLPLLEHLVLWSGEFQEELLVALLDYCPRLVLLDVRHCDPLFRIWRNPIERRIESCTIKDLRLPYAHLY